MLSQKAKYALQALSYLSGKYKENEAVLIQTIAQEKKIPLKFLEAILLELKKNDILISFRGRAGGYKLKDSPKKTNIATIMRIIDGPIAMLSCVSLHFFKACDNCTIETCSTNTIMSEARDALLKVLEKRTLQDLMDKVV
jgi:Rrf2 family protein